FHRSVRRRRLDKPLQTLCQLLRLSLRERHAGPGRDAVALEPMRHVPVLLEVVRQREVEERYAGGDEFHRRRQAPLHQGGVGRRQHAVQVVDVAVVLHAFDTGQRGGVYARAAHNLQTQVRHPLAGQGERRGDAPEQRGPNAGATHGRYSHLLVTTEAELRSQVRSVSEVRWVEVAYVAAQFVVLGQPVADQGQVRPERVRHDVALFTYVDRGVADTLEALDLLDHLGVVVRRHEGLAPAVVLDHGQVADEIRQPGERRGLQLRVLVEVVVHLPGFVAHPHVVRLLAHDV